MSLRSLAAAWKTTLVLNLLCLALVAIPSALWLGCRLPVGTFGLSVLRDPVGTPFLVVDHVSTQGWLVGYDCHSHRLQTWEGTILPQ